MCIATWCWQAHSRYSLIIVANRDEFHERPTAPLARWDDGSGLIAGRDLKSGGTWLGLSADTGRLALITNFRDPTNFQPEAPSRGALVTDWLTGAWNRPDDRLGTLPTYNGFSLLLIDKDGGWVLDNRTMDQAQPLPTGITGLSNGPFGKPWPKTTHLMNALHSSIANDDLSEDALFGLLAKGGANVAAESADAPIFIRNEVYGTRASTIVLLDPQGKGLIAERRFDPEGHCSGETRIAL